MQYQHMQGSVSKFIFIYVDLFTKGICSKYVYPTFSSKRNFEIFKPYITYGSFRLINNW